MYNDMNNEQINGQNFGPIHEVDDESNLHPVNNTADEEPIHIERRARRVHRCSSSAVEIARTSEVRPNVTEGDSDNAITKDVAIIMDKAARAYTELEYNRYMEELRNLHPNAYDYVLDTGPYKLSRVHCPNRRYIVMTTNAVKCINSWLKFARQLPMLTLAEFIRNMKQHWFHDRHIAAQSMHYQ
ncbi:hypothetical protein Ddye_008354 [Dipteronia dyeriana]|uniref:Uncharacterized protein n=1 Tax=Dipteronia dyeriana TaxID=168575 RepID=A0AAE0CL88_9ROSI|nr:hypothetical protein Ddye_008354 [Dipteronia dyeriana]